MALSSRSEQSLLLDSTYRNRIQNPRPTEFISTSRVTTEQPRDPVALGYPLYSTTLNGTYTAGTPGYVTLTTGIPATFGEDKLLNHYLEVVDPGSLAVKGSARVIGFGSATPYVVVYLETALTNTANLDLVYIRQYQSSPYRRFFSAAFAAGVSTITYSLAGQELVNMFLRNITGGVGAYRVISVVTGTSFTIQPPLTAGVNLNDILELYQVKDNEPGFNISIGGAQSGQVNYEISLEWVRFPRQPIYVNEAASSLALGINRFPYLVVELRNQGEGTRGAIMSNNPGILKGKFAVTIEDDSTSTGKFYTLKAGNKVTAKFNPTLPVYFAIFLPDGSPLYFDADDEGGAGLAKPNPDFQVSALFTLRQTL
jgi:hypothetical protein